MGIERVVLDDFTGGFLPRLAATDFSDRQWAKLHGFVLEDQTRIRSQWPLQKIGSAHTGFTELAMVDGRLIAKKSDGTFWWREYPLSTLSDADAAALTWTQLTAITADTNLHLCGSIPMRNESTDGFEQGILINGRDRTGSAYGVYWDQTGGALTVKAWTTKWPQSGGTDDCMPPANTSVMWGSFLVLGDIRWYKNSDQALSDTNNKVFSNGLWFSAGGDIDKFDPLDVQFSEDILGHDWSDISSLWPMDMGLLIFSGAGTALLRGTPSDHVYEVLRQSVSPKDGTKVAYWPHTGTVTWVDRVGSVWHTNGEQFVRLDAHDLDLGRTTGSYDHTVGWGEFLLVNRNGRLLCFRAFERDGAWTELIPPTAATAGTTNVRDMVALGDQLYFLDDDGMCWRFNRRYEDAVDGTSNRGEIHGVAQTLTVASRTLDTGGGHHKTFWHRAMVRGNGNVGTIEQVKWRPGPALDSAQPTATTTLSASLTDRYELAVPAGGPSSEASVEVTFTGDVEVEQLEVLYHQGRASR